MGAFNDMFMLLKEGPLSFAYAHQKSLCSQKKPAYWSRKRDLDLQVFKKFKSMLEP